MTRKPNSFAGDFLPFSRRLAVWGFSEVVKARSRAAFVASFNRVPCVIVPEIRPDSITLTVFYASLRRLSVARLARGHLAEIVQNWRGYCRAYVQCELVSACLPTLVPLDHNATRNAAAALTREAGWLPFPSFSAIDDALNTSLTLFSEAHSERVQEIHNALA